MKKHQYITCSLSVLAALLCSVFAFSSEILINGDRVIIKADDGEIIDTSNPPPTPAIQEGKNVHVHENGISIGSMINNGRIQENVSRNTMLDNVTIINNGKTTIYRKGKSSTDRTGEN